MNQSNFFKKSFSVFIAVFLIVMAFVKSDNQIWYYSIIFALWIIAIATHFLINLIKKKKEKKNHQNAQSISADTLIIPDSLDVDKVLLCHVNHRISSFLQSVYPEITWDWFSKDPEQHILNGGTARIRLFGMTDFNYADIEFSRVADINCSLVKVVPLSQLQNETQEHLNINQNYDLSDPEEWYNSKGKQILEACVADLHSRGIASLIIKDNGDICFRQTDIESLEDKFQSFPVKDVWQKLVKVIEKYSGLSAKSEDDVIRISW